MKYSVCIPMYNEGSIIEDTAKKLSAYLERTYGEDYELIFYDDGSSDRSPELVTALDLPRVRVIEGKENHGKGRGVRTSVLSSSGEYVMFTDADLAFNIGINLGLDADEAAEIGDRAYGVISERITKECIELAYRSGMPLKELLDYASDRGLRENELKRLSKSIKAYSTDSEISDEELEKILEQASKNQ